MRIRFIRSRLEYRNRYHRPVVDRLVRDGIFGYGNAWCRWPRPQAGRPTFTLIVGGRP
jgi:hypothetical protein